MASHFASVSEPSDHLDPEDVELAVEITPTSVIKVRPDERVELRFPPGCIRGESAVMRDLYDQMRSVVAGDLPVLITGETGVGKEVFARIFHLSSPRSKAPFVAINCAAIPAELLEAELFGIGKGVATGVAPRQGKLALAQEGTLFLDEIGDMPPRLQAKLLRSLQEKEIQPVGGEPMKVDLRVISATNVKLSERLEDGSFRRDLFYRLAGFELRIPPLRERQDDIPGLVERFLRRFGEEAAKPVRGLSVAAMEALRRYSWPGNVRQLEHEIRRLVYLCPPGQVIRSSLLSEEIRNGSSHKSADIPAGSSAAKLPTLNLKELERQALHEALRLSRGSQVEAARRLGISRFALRRRLDQHGF